MSKIFIIKKLENSNKNFAIVVSKKVDKRASARNKIRRQVKTVLLRNITNFSNGNYLIVVKHTSDITKIEFKELEQDLLKALH